MFKSLLVSITFTPMRQLYTHCKEDAPNYRSNAKVYTLSPIGLCGHLVVEH